MASTPACARFRSPRTNTVRQAPPVSCARPKEPGDGVLCEAFLCIGGRRGGKSKAVSTFCAWLAACCDWTSDLSLGERGRVMFVAPALDQASNTMGYLRD